MTRPEKRWASRSPLWLRTSLYLDGKFSRFGLASDFSLNGLFLICKTNELSQGQTIEVEFRQDYAGIEKQCYVSAEVTRIGRDGIGVSFCHHDCNHFSCLQKLLSAHSVHYKEAGKQPAPRPEENHAA